MTEPLGMQKARPEETCGMQEAYPAEHPGRQRRALPEVEGLLE